MRLIPEEIKYLESKKELLTRIYKNYQEQLRDSERDKTDGQPIPHQFEIDGKPGRINASLINIEHLLSDSEYVIMRNFDTIDVGTGFILQFLDDGEIERYILTEKGIISTVDSDSKFKFISLEGNLGKAVKGAKQGDTVSYLDAQDNLQSAVVIAIDNIREHYANFLREEAMKKEQDERILPTDITPSQKELALSEKENRARSKKDLVAINEVLNIPMATLPTDDTIGIGSHVIVNVESASGLSERIIFELIKKAVTIELDCQYVECDSALGKAIFGLKEGEYFTYITENGLPLKGKIVSVDNNYLDEKVRVR